MRIILLYISLAVTAFSAAQTQNKFLAIKPEGHTGMIRAMVIDNEGKIITAGLDKTIKVWNSEQGYLEREILGQIGDGCEGIIYSLAISPDNKYLAVSGWFGDDPGYEGYDIKDVTDIRLYEYKTGKLIRLLKGHYDIALEIAFSPSSDCMYSVDQFGSVLFWDLKENTHQEMEQFGNDVNDLKIFSDCIVTSHRNGMVNQWNLKQPMKPIYSYKRLYRNKVPANKLAISPTGEHIAVSCGHLVIILDQYLKEINAYVNGKPEHKITKLSFSNDGKRLLVAACSGFIENQIMKVYEKITGDWAVISSYKKHKDAVLCAAFVNDSVCVTAGGLQNEIVVWRAKDHKKYGPIVHELIGYGNIPYSVGMKHNKIALGTKSNIQNFGLSPYNFVFDFYERNVQSYDSTESFPKPIHEFNDYSLEISNNNSTLYIKKGNKIISSIKRDIYSGFSHFSVTFALEKFLVSGGGFGRLDAFDLMGNKLTSMTGHTGDVIGLSVSDDKQFLISSGRDQTIRLWKLKDIGKHETIYPVVSLFIAQNEEWVIWTEEGYYTSSKKGASYVGFHINQGRNREAKFYSFEQFDYKYNRPDIVLANLNFIDKSIVELYHAAYLKRLKRMQLDEAALSDVINVPVIDIVAYGTNQNSGTITIEASDSLFTIKAVNIYLNEVPIYGLNGLPIEHLGLNYFERTVELELISGINNIEVSVTNSVGAESLKEKVVLYNEHQTESNLYLVSIGVSEYEDSTYNLEYAAKDAEDVNTLFSGVDFYTNVYNKLLTNDMVTREKLSELKEFLAKAQRNDVVLFFIAGHGVRDNNLDYFFCTYDMDFLLPDKNGISYEQLESLFDGIRAIRKLLIMDTCLSGKIYRDEIEALTNEGAKFNDSLNFRNIDSSVIFQEKKNLEKTIEILKQMFSDISTGTGTTVISSAGGIEYALEGDNWENGLFTYCLLDGIRTKSADINKDGDIMLSELKNYLTKRVNELSNGMQIPTSRFENLNMDFRVW
ncbi:MAG: caspase family protein [Crocinitomicaceae bacterium]|nr:caspase family protein [Crocinitomicaceae bacterium]MBK8927158.1 caspase family protein [Crocinitomicaceae bacterium]